MSGRRLDVDVVSDVVCPWCFIGKRFLDAALATLRVEEPDLDVRVLWHPYLLNPDTPPGGEPYRPFLERKFGGPAEVEAIWQRVREAGGRAGIRFAFERIATRPPTSDAHRLIARVQAQGDDAAALVEALFAAHFEAGEDIGDRAVLARIAAATAGRSPADWSDFIASGDGGPELAAGLDEAARIGVRGVPFFIFGRRLAVSGAQPPDILRSTLREAMAAGRSGAG